MQKHDVIHKTGSTQRIALSSHRTKLRSQLTTADNFVKFGHVVFEICETDKQTYRQTDKLIANNMRCGEEATYRNQKRSIHCYVMIEYPSLTERDLSQSVARRRTNTCRWTESVVTWWRHALVANQQHVLRILAGVAHECRTVWTHRWADNHRNDMKDGGLYTQRQTVPLSCSVFNLFKLWQSIINCSDSVAVHTERTRYVRQRLNEALPSIHRVRPKLLDQPLSSFFISAPLFL